MSLRTDERLRNLWVAVESRGWSSLAIIPTNGSVDTHEIAELVAKLAFWHGGRSCSVVDLRDLSPRLLEYQQRELRAHVGAGSRVIIALRPMHENPTTVPMARDADAVVLCIDLGKTARKVAEETLAAVGHDRVLGSIVLRDDDATNANRKR